MFFFKNFSKNFISTSIGVFFCRIAGFIRDLSLSFIFGTSLVLSIFLTIFSIINTFRGIFGEGPTRAVIIPQTIHKLNEDRKNAKNYSSLILSNIVVILFQLICILSIIFFFFIFIFPEQKFSWQVSLILLPYALFISISAIFSGLLNIKKYFFIPSISSIILNLTIISFCLGFSSNISNFKNKILFLCIFITLSGIIQAFLLYKKLHKSNWKLKFKANFKNKDWQNFKQLFSPVFISIIFINGSLYIDRGLAWMISQNAVSSLYFAERLTYLPVGLFGVSLATSSLPLISQNFSKKDFKLAENNLFNYFIQILTLSIPATIFLLFFKKETLTLLFFRGNFDKKSLEITQHALSFFLIGIPAFCLIKIILIAYHSQNNTKIPFYASILGLCINLIISLSLIPFFQEGAIALGTVISAYISFLFLCIKLPNLNRIKIITKLIYYSLFLSITSIIIFSYSKNFISTGKNSFIQAIELLSIASIGIILNFIIISFLKKSFLKKIANKFLYKP